MKTKIDKFNYWYDFLARVVRILLLLGLILLFVVFRMWRYINWPDIPRDIIDKYTFLKISPPSTTSIVGTTEIDYVNIYQNGKVVFTVDKQYDVSKKQLTIDKMVIKDEPNYKQSFLYAGVKIRIVHIKERIELLISNNGVEGPVLRGVDCIVE